MVLDTEKNMETNPDQTCILVYPSVIATAYRKVAKCQFVCLFFGLTHQSSKITPGFVLMNDNWWPWGIIWGAADPNWVNIYKKISLPAVLPLLKASSNYCKKWISGHRETIQKVGHLLCIWLTWAQSSTLHMIPKSARSIP